MKILTTFHSLINLHKYAQTDVYAALEGIKEKEGKRTRRRK